MNYINRLIERIDIVSESNDNDSLYNIMGNHINCRYMLVRNHIAEMLMDYHSKQSFVMLNSLLADKDRVVRASACESLSIFADIETLNILLDVILNDRSALVRKYAASSILSILQKRNLKDTLKPDFFEYRKEKNIPARISYFMILYYLGEEKYLDCILGYINHKNYINRINAINALIQILTLENHQIIKVAVDKAVKSEESIAVKSSIRELYINISVLQGEEESGCIDLRR